MLSTVEVAGDDLVNCLLSLVTDAVQDVRPSFASFFFLMCCVDRERPSHHHLCQPS
jgi:hypothetical protein